MTKKEKKRQRRVAISALAFLANATDDDIWREWTTRTVFYQTPERPPLARMYRELAVIYLAQIQP